MTTHVLICDDSSVARKQMARSLPGDWDIDVSFAQNGEEALSAINEGLGDILFLDLNMPVMDGYETLEHIKQQDLPTMTIVVSSDIQPEAHSRVHKLGALDFIQKPTCSEEIVGLLDKFGLYRAEERVAKADDTGEIAPAIIRKGEVGEINTRDCMQEVANVAMGKAADLLARLLHSFVKLPIPKVNLLEVNELQMALSLTEQGDTYSAVCQGFIGSGISGEALLIFTDSSFHDIAELLNYQGELDDAAELELIMEVTNILVGACINGIAEQLDTYFSQGHPVVLGQHVKVSDLVHANADNWNQVLAVEITYEIENHNICCDLLLLFTEDSMDILNRQISYLMD